MLHMTGPAASQQLRRIEAEIGTEVVAADGRGVRLTDKGRMLADYARRVSELMQQADNDLHYDEEPVGRLHVGALASIIRGLLAHALPSFQQSHPGVEVTIEDGETTDHLDRLATGRIDLVLAETWSTAPLHLPAGVLARRVARERVCVALPENHSLSQRKHFDVGDLTAEPWATCARNSHGHAALVQAARQRGVELDIRHFVADHATQLTLVSNGLAIACLPMTDDASNGHGVIYRRLRPEMHRDVVLLTSGRVASLALESLTGHLLGPR